MRVLAVLAAVLVAASATPRERRQLDHQVDVPCEAKRGDVYVPGVCVPYYICGDDGVINTGGIGIIDIRVGNPASENFISCPQSLDVCCIDPTATVPPPPKYVAGCGRRNNQGIDVRVQGFTEGQSQFAEFPWVAAVLRTEKVDHEDINLYLCGGSLIHPSLVLTAAHCIVDYYNNPGVLQVRLGEWDTQNTLEKYPHQDRGVQNVVIHQNYTPGVLYNDFALIHLSEPAVLDFNVDTVCLKSNQHYDGQRCIVTGWGKDKFGKEGLFQNVLKNIDLPLVPHGACQNYLRQTRLTRRFILNKSFTCAGGEAGKDACTGDGGSPLVCLDQSGSYVQSGIVAWGIGCGTANVPGVYADTDYAYNWIEREAGHLLGVGTNYKDYWTV